MYIKVVYCEHTTNKKFFVLKYNVKLITHFVPNSIEKVALSWNYLTIYGIKKFALSQTKRDSSCFSFAPLFQHIERARCTN